MDNEKIQELLKEEMSKDFSTMEKVKAFTYHIGMVLFGSVLCPEKHKDCMKVFDEFVKLNKSKESV